MEQLESKLTLVRVGANWLIYASVLLGITLLIQLYSLAVPAWLFYSILAGCISYLGVAVAVATHHSRAYPAALVLAIATLVVSLPQPEHSSLVAAGPTAASLTFVGGSILQIGVIASVSSYLLLKRKQFRMRKDSDLVRTLARRA